MPNPPTPPWAIAAAGALSLAVAMGVGRFAFTPMLPLMIAGGQLDVAAGGWIAAANYAGYLAGALTASRVRWSAERLCAVALLLTALLTAAMAWSWPAWMWATLRFVAGACSAWAFVGTAVWCLGALAAGRGAWSAGVYSGVGLGIAAAGLLCLAGASAGVSAPGLWLALATLAALLLVPVALVMRRAGRHEAPAASAAGSSNPSNSSSVAPAAKLPAGTTSLVWCYGALGFGYILPATFLPVMARSVVEDPRLFGLAWPVFGLTAAASTFVAARALRHASRLQVWAASHLVMGVGVLLPSLWLSGLTIALSALMVGGTFMIVTMVGVQEMRARAAGGNATSLVSRTTAAFALGQIAGPIASSLLLHMPAMAANGLAIALQVASASLFVTALWLWRFDTRIRHSPETSHVH